MIRIIIFLILITFNNTAFSEVYNGDIDTFEDSYQDLNDWIAYPSIPILGVEIKYPGYNSNYCIGMTGEGLNKDIASLTPVNKGYLSIEKFTEWEERAVFTLKCMVKADKASTAKFYLECNDPDGDVVLAQGHPFTPPVDWTECILNGNIRTSPITTVKLWYEAGSGTIYVDNVYLYNSTPCLRSDKPIICYIQDNNDATFTLTIHRFQGATSASTSIIRIYDPFGNIILTKTYEPGTQSYDIHIPSDNIKGDYRLEIPQDIHSVWKIYSSNKFILDGDEGNICIGSAVDSILFFCVSDNATFTLNLKSDINDSGICSATLYNPNGLAVKKVIWDAGDGQWHELGMDTPVKGGIWAVGLSNQGAVTITSKGIPPYFSVTQAAYFLPDVWLYPKTYYPVAADTGANITTVDDMLTLSIPPWGINANATISIQKIEPPVLPKGYVLVSPVYNIEFTGDEQPEVLQDMTLIFRYDSSLLTYEEENSLGIFYYEVGTMTNTTGIWQPITTIERSTAENFIRVNITHLTPFAMLSAPVWYIQLTAESSDGCRDKMNYFGFDPGALDTYGDTFDLEEEPPPPSPYISLYVVAPDGTQYTKDIRRLKDLTVGIEEWEFEVRTYITGRGGGHVTITCDISSVPDDYPISLIEVNQQQINLRDITGYTFEAPRGDSIRRFILRVGGEAEGTITMSHEFMDRWNLCSIPLLPVNPAPEAVFNIIPAHMLRISKFVNGSYVAYEPDSDFGTITPGVGYWFKPDRPVTIEVVGYSLEDRGTYTIPINTGWNLIGNPFTFNISWNEIILAHGTTTEIVTEGVSIRNGFYRYEIDRRGRGGYRLERYRGNPIMRPWEAYWIFSSVDGMLMIPPIPSHPSAEVHAPEMFQHGNNNNWEVRLSVFTDKSVDTDNYIGIAEDASDKYNKYCIQEPPEQYSPYVALYFPCYDWAEYSGKFACVYKPHVTPNTSQIWEFEIAVYGMINTDVILQWEGVPDNYQLTLIDLEENRRINMHNTSSYMYNTGRVHIRQFQIIVTAKDMQNIQLQQNIYPYPNPLTINGLGYEEFIFHGLVDTSETVIRIYTLSGELVTTIKDSEKWDGRNTHGQIVASGVYIYVVEFKGKVIKKGKLAVIR